MSHFAIAGLQLALPSGNNLDVIAKEIERTKKRFPWVDMIVLTELASYGPDKCYAESLPNQSEELYCDLAKKHDVWLIPGSVFEKDGDDIYNTASVINNHGEVVERYRKIYPFSPYETGITPGSDLVVFDVPQGRIGVAICYDLWFPEVSRALACKGAEVLIYPTMTGTIDRPLELAMAQSTAATNQCYVFAINTAGELGNGQSIVVSPQGQVIYQAGAGVEVIPVEVDFEQVRRSRSRGILGLGQPLKSFRDNSVRFPQYQSEDSPDKQAIVETLERLGPLEVPTNN